MKEKHMAPNTLPGWAHPYDSPFIWYADGGDDPAPGPMVVVEPEPAEPADDWTPPTREEYEETIAKLKTASGEAAARRKYLKAHGIDPKTGQKAQPDEPDPEPEPQGDQPQGITAAEMKKQIDRAVAEAKIEGMRGAKKLVGAFNKALAEAGWNGQRLELIMPLVDFEEVDLDDEEDLRERLEAVKKIFPEGFKRTRNPANPSNGAGGSGQNGVPAAKVDAADKPAPKPEPKGWAETLAQRALRG
jgi:hypothetical protein